MVGIYIHIPFCLKKCSYCDFYSVPYSRPLADTYVRHLSAEIDIFCSHTDPAILDHISTLYIGGGTPSLLGVSHFRTIVESLRKHFDLSGLLEFTIEVNPGTLSSTKLNLYRNAGVNRISMGAQSFNDRHLKKLGRIHRAKEIIQAVNGVREAGFSNVNIDLIFGIPLQTEEEMMEDMKEALLLSPSHLSVYALSVEEETPLFEEVQCGLEIPSDEEFALYYRKLESSLEKEGYRHYEISNFAKKDYECAHNIGYWTGEEYIGFGAGSSGYLKRNHESGGLRYTNHQHVGEYIKTIDRGQLPRAETQETDATTAWKERLIMGLRLTDGISLEKIRKELGDPPRSLYKAIHRLVSSNLLELDGDSLKIPPVFYFTSNEVLSKLV